MNPREKMLAACVVGVLTLGGLWVVVKWGVIDRWESLHKNIDTAVKQEKDVRGRLEEARLAEKRWSEFLPLSHNPDKAQDAFRVDVTRLLEQHGLNEDPQYAVRPLPQRKLKTGFTEVRLTIQARGTLRQLMGFLCDMYRRDYLAKLEQISLATENQSTRTRSSGRVVRGGRGRLDAAMPGDAAVGPDGPRLNLSMSATALVLPEIVGVPQGIFDPEMNPDSLGRLPRAPAEYEMVSAQNLFKEGGPEPVVVATQPTGTRPVAVIDKPPPPIPPRPEKTLVGVTSTLGRLEAYVRDMSAREKAPEKVTLNGAVDDGSLVLVVPRGIVVQVAGESGSGFGYKYYFYKLGAPFSAREELTPGSYPELQQQLELSLVPKGGPDER